MTYLFDTAYFAPAKIKDPWLSGRVIESGQTVSNIMPVVKTDGGGLWRVGFSSISLRTRERVLAWRAWINNHDGGAAPIIVRFPELRQAPTISGGSEVDLVALDGSLITALDGSTISTGSTPGVVCHGGAALRATTIRITVSAGSVLLPGQRFSALHAVMNKRCYEIGQVLDDDGAGTYQVTIRPPLREALSDGETLDFRDPGCLMRAVDPEAVAADIDLLRFGGAGVDFIETF